MNESFSPSKWDCQIEESSKTQNPNVWTVGDIYLLSCKGSDQFDLEPPVKFIFENPKDQFALHALNLIKSETHSFQIELTSYRPGEYEFETLRLQDEQLREVTLERLSWKVQSVIDPKEPPQAFAGFGFLQLQYSLWLMILLAAAAVILAFWAVLRFFQRSSIRRLVIQKIGLQGSESTAGDPALEFGRTARRLRRKWSLPKTMPEKISSKDFVVRLKQEFELFLVRSLQLPFHCRTLKQLRRWMKKSHREVEAQHYLDLQLYFMELQKALALTEPLEQDCEQLYRLGLKLTASIKETLEKKKRAVEEST